MKKLLLSLNALFLGATISFAGSGGKDYKDKIIEPTEFFRAGELQLGIFGAYAGGNVDKEGRTAHFHTSTVRLRETVVDVTPPNGAPTFVTRVDRERITHTRTINS